MVDVSLIGRCGLYCGYCSIFRSFKDSKSLQEKIAALYNCNIEDVRCDGCQTVDGYSWCQEKKYGGNCPIVKCLDLRNIVYCFECNEYLVCSRFNEFAEENLEKIGVDIEESLKTLKENGPEEWLTAQDKRWRCKKCGNSIIVSELIDKCHWCSEKIDMNSFIRARKGG
jgi:hypothetical protein